MMSVFNENHSTVIIPHPAVAERHINSVEALRIELRQARIVAQVGPLVAAERNYVRRLRILTRAAAAVGGGRAVLYAIDRPTQRLIPMAVMDGLTGESETFQPSNSGITTIPQLRTLAVGEGLAGMTAQRGKPLILPDLAASSLVHSSLFLPDAEILGIEPIAVVCLPLYDTGTLIGVLEVAQSSLGHGFDEHTVDFLSGIGGQMTLALTIELRERDLRLERIRLSEAQEAERQRLTRDLRTGPAAGVAGAVAVIETIDGMITSHPNEARVELRRLHTALTVTLRATRGVLFDLRPFALEVDGLAQALHNLGEHFREHSSLHMRWTIDLPERLPATMETAIYLIVREALTNVIRHAQATACMIEVCQSPAKVAVIIRDNGEGFDSEAVLASYPRGQSWGLLNMFERARTISAEIAIRSRPEQGTSVEMEIAMPLLLPPSSSR